MLRACKYCGKIHDSKYNCGKIPPKYRQRKEHDWDKFRHTKAWRCKAAEIRQRDKELCQVCMRELHNTINKYTYTNLSVHHNIPLHEDYNKRLDNDNLLTMCAYHHTMSDDGRITREEIKGIIEEQESKAV